MSVGELPTRTTTREKGRMRAPTPPLGHAHVMEVDDVIAALDTSYQCLAHHQAQARLQRYGPNALPQAKVPGTRGEIDKDEFENESACFPSEHKALTRLGINSGVKLRHRVPHEAARRFQ